MPEGVRDRSVPDLLTRSEAMGVKRYELSQAQWARIAPMPPGKAADPGRTASDNLLWLR